MAERRFDVDADIRRARTPPRELYFDPQWFAQQRETVFARSWNFASVSAGLETSGCARPLTLLPGCLDEPLILVRDTHAKLHLLSNVCTHRGHLVVERECALAALRCNYHGRRFHLDGSFAFMPGFENAEHFPTESDWLTKVPLAEWRGMLFASLAPNAPVNEVVAEVERRLAGLAIVDWRYDPTLDKTFEFDANWALYVENYLEGLHIPFIHPALAAKLDGKLYGYENLPYGTLQIGSAAPGELAFELPEGHPNFGQRIGAYYFWLFPATMLNLYPWGLSLNVIEPLAPTRTRVRFLSFVQDPAKREQGAGSGLVQVEMEDEAAIQQVQKGMRARSYRGGRYAPTAEIGVHHFHRMLAKWMA
ncbi:MAG: Rieske 2Fe-2S domain-containing protein [Planctomycetes bacterium]|nr:Rieske 2Fe-2S domain-containing protein [Planctomycetota bacterium]